MATSTLIALTRAVPPSIDRCALSFMERDPVDVSLAQRQHEEYVSALESLGLRMQALPPEPEMPDSVFVEDVAVVVDEVAVITYPTLPSRASERDSVAEVLADYRPLERITGEGRLEGGDVLRVGRTLYVGRSRRSNGEGIAQLRRILKPYGYEVVSVPVPGCLHLKTGATAIGPRTLLANRAWIDTDPFADLEILPVPVHEDFAANVLTLGNSVVMPAGFPQTEALLKARGLNICAVDVSELQKAEAGVTCCSIVFSGTARSAE